MKQRGKHSAFSRLLTGGLALALSLNLLPGAVLAAEAEGDELYTDNFESGTLSEQWTKPSDSNAYQIVDEGIDGKSLLLQSTLQSIQGQEHVGWEWRMSYNPQNAAEWQDYSIQMEFKLGEELTAGIDYNNPTWNGNGIYDSISILGRTNESGSDYWGLIYRTDTHKLELNKCTGGIGKMHAEKTEYELTANQVYQLKLDFHENSISAYIAEKGQEFGDAVLTLEDKDLGTAPLTSGGWGIMVEGCQAYIDNVRVVGLLTEIPLTGLSLTQSKLSLEKGQSRQLGVNYTPADASSKDVSWSTDDAAVATVDQEGNVTAVGAGTTQITVTSDEYSNITAACEVMVYETVDCSTFYYVATDGSDTAGDGSKENPFQTLEKARDTIRDLATIPDGGITVYLRGGEYSLDETFTLTPEDSGEAGKPIVYASYPGEEATVVSKEYITGWEKLEESVYGMPADSVENVYVADIPEGWRFHFLYDDGQSQPVSAMTQSDDWESWPKVDGEGEGQPSDNGLLLHFGDGVLDGLDGWTDAEISMSTAIWWNINGVLSDIDATAKTGRLETKITVLYNPIELYGGGNYNLTNVPKYLDEAGEWAVDSQNGKVYYWPADGADPNDSTIFAPKLYELVRFQGDEEDQGWAQQVHDVVLRDLSFYYSDRTPENLLDSEWLTRNGENPDGMIFMQGVRECVIEDCVVAYSGAQGISVDHYAQDCRFVGNEIAYASSGGIQITGYGPGNVDVNKNHLIARNHIHNVGLDYMHSNGVQLYGSNNVVIEYNYFHDLPYSAVSIIGMRFDQMNGQMAVDTFDAYGSQQSMYQARWEEFRDDSSLVDNDSSKKYQHSDNNVIQYNVCDDYMQVMRDGGALYCWASGINKVWQYNVGSREASGDWAIRAIHMDDYDVYNTIKGNLFYATGTTDNSHEQHKNTWVDNIITRDSYPEGYLDLRAQITDTANQDGGWMVSLPDSITVTAPTKTEYYVGEALNLAGMAVKASVGIEYQQTITEGYTVSGYDPTKEGTQTVTVSYGGKSDSFQVTVSKVPVPACSADAAIRVDESRDAAGNAVFRFNLIDAENIAAVQATVEMPKGANIEGVNGFSYLDSETDSDLMVLCYLQDSTYTAQGETTIATIKVPESAAAEPTVRISDVRIASYDVDGEPAWGDTVKIVAAEATWEKDDSSGGSTGGGSSTGGGTPPQKELPFIDVENGDWFYDAVEYAVEHKLMNGVSATEFAPDSPMTRAMFVTVLARMEGVDTSKGSTWYEVGWQWAMENGISDGTNMEKSITREQLATMLYRYAGSPTVSGVISGFPDADKVSQWAEDGMLWAVQNGIISGSSGKLNPQGDASRAQVAAMLMRFNTK